MVEDGTKQKPHDAREHLKQCAKQKTGGCEHQVFLSGLGPGSSPGPQMSCPTALSLTEHNAAWEQTTVVEAVSASAWSGQQKQMLTWAHPCRSVHLLLRVL